MFDVALPIYAQREEISQALQSSNVVIITAQTGAGKSTQVPQFLLEEGYNLVVTQPRRLATRTVAARVAEEYGVVLGDVVGYRTAYERQDSAATRCLFATDGLALVRELMGVGQHTVLVLDEVHEWNLNIEVLVAWAKHQIDEGASFKVVLMSATLEVERLREYFDGVPVIDVPGRTFPVEERKPGGLRLEDDVAALLRQGRNVLVFQPGKREIGETIECLQDMMGGNAEIMPLHGELTSEEQARCFRPSRQPKCVVSTNVAQTSVTIPDIDAVVDSGVERRVELVDGIEGLYLKPISWADREQRKGRAGRTKLGIYIDWCPSAERLAFPLAEVLRVRLDQTVLRLAEVGIDMEGLTFFHQPDQSEIHKAKQALMTLGCMDPAGGVTKIGHRVAKMPISVKYGRMIVEAERLGVVDDVITVAAILEQGGIVARVCPAHQRAGIPYCACWKCLAPGETASDVMAQLAAYRACAMMSKDEMREAGVFVKGYYQAKEKRWHLSASLRKQVRRFQSSGKRNDILLAVCAGMVGHVFEYASGSYKSSDGQYRELGRESIVKPTIGQQGCSRHWLVGEPFDLQVSTPRGSRVLRLIQMATRIEPQWLVEVAPQLVKVVSGLNARFDDEQDEVVSTTETWFNGQVLIREERIDPGHAEAAQLRREGRNHRMWKAWYAGAVKPAVALPDPVDDQAVIPEIVTAVYGYDSEDASPLIAYGVVVYNLARRHLSNDRFMVSWVKSQTEACRLRAQTIAQLEQWRAERGLAEKRRQQSEEMSRLRQAVEPLREQIVQLWQKHGYDNQLPRELRHRLHGLQFMYASNPETVREWALRAGAVVTELNEAVATADRRRIEETRLLNRLWSRALELRNRVNGLLVDHGEDFADEVYDRLVEFDVDDQRLPFDIAELEYWIDRAEAVMTEAEAALPARKPLTVSDDDLRALADRFGRA